MKRKSPMAMSKGMEEYATKRNAEMKGVPAPKMPMAKAPEMKMAPTKKGGKAKKKKSK